MYSKVAFIRGYSRFQSDGYGQYQDRETDSSVQNVEMEHPEYQPFCGPKSYYANPEVFSELKSDDIPQPGGKIEIRHIELED